MKTRLVAGLGAFVYITFLLGVGSFSVQAANPDGALRVEVIAAPNFVVDSNIQTPAGQSPRCAFIGAKFYNDGLVDLTNLTVYIGQYNGGTNSTPGLFPRRAHPGLAGPLPGGEFALALESGSTGIRDASRTIGTLKAGDCMTVYWLVSYPLLDANHVPVWGSGPDSSDDLWLTYDIWASGLKGASALKAAQTTRATMRNEITAMANKIYPNTANQVPQQYQDMLRQYEPTWTNVPADGTVGTRIIAEGIWYMLGNVGMGYDGDGDLVYDHDAWLQPVGNPDLFDAGAFRLVRTRTLLIVQLKNGGEQIIMADDQLYFKDLPENNSVVGYVRYEFIPVLPNIISQLTPYQEAASGSNNEKFNADYGAMVGGGLEGLAGRIEIDKTASLTSAVPGQVIQYQIAYTNAGTQAVGNPDRRLPVVIIDSVPTGTVYTAGSAASSNALPAGVTNYTVYYSTNHGVTWSANEPAVATNVTDIQWWLSDTFNPTSAGVIRFSVQVKNPYTNGPVVANTAGITVGDNPPFTNDIVITTIRGNNALGDTVFADTGVGGGYLGDGIQDGAEPGISNILVTVYFDHNGDGAVNGADYAVASTRTSATGTYLFTNLVDGTFIARVDAFDANLPVGYTLTTSNSIPVALDPGRATTSSVSVLTADFGFAPALSVTKTLVGTNTLYEGRAVNYSISVVNNLMGDGAGGYAPVTYMAWGSAIHADQTTSGWVNPTNAAGTPDGRYATDTFIANPIDYITTTEFRMRVPVGSITNVQIVVPVEVVAPWRAGDVFSVTLVDSNANEFYRASYTGDAAVATGTIVLDVTSRRAWQWSDFNSSNVSIRVVAEKGGTPSQGGWIGVDTAGFLVRSSVISISGSSDNTLNPVPLEDVYDPAKLQFVSAAPAPSVVTNIGTSGLIRWDNLGPLFAGGSRTVALTFKALQPPGNALTVITNDASVTNAWFASGRRSNDGRSQVVTNLQPAGVIGDYIWRDTDQDGVQATNEYGIPNVQVVLQPPAGVNAGAGPGVALTNLTDRSGYYLFEGIPSTGRYVVLVLTNSLPAGAVNTYSEMAGTVSPTNLTVVTNLFPSSSTGGDVHRTADFGYNWNGSLIYGQVWNDVNRSGTTAPDAGEPGFATVTVYLYNATNLSVAIATNYTDAGGYYRFAGNYAGTYVVAVTTNSGGLAGETWLRTYDTDGTSTPDRVSVTVALGGSGSADFSYFRSGPYAIGDTLFYDWNGNGVQDANDEGIPSIPVRLYLDVNSNGTLETASDLPLETAVTDIQGLYLFTNYAAGAYLVDVQQSDPGFPRMYRVTADPYGAKDGFSRVVLTNASNWAQDFGYQPTGSGEIGDTVWRDLIPDGVQSGLNETGISNVPVRLQADLNGDGIYVQVASTNTDAAGRYLFSRLPAGSYKAAVFASGSALPLDSFGSSYVPTTVTNVTVALESGSFLDADFGFAALGAIGNTIFWDNNANGAQDLNEPGIPGVTVNLYVDENRDRLYEAGVDTFSASLVTGANGLYVFTNLVSEYYLVRVYTNGGPTAGSVLTAAPKLDGQPLTNAALQDLYNQCPVIIEGDTAFMGADFGFQPPGALGKMVWIDSNANGIREDGEQGIPGAGVVLSNATAVLTNRTDGDGYYSFGGVADGTYSMRVLTNASGFPAGLAPTYDPDGTNTPGFIAAIVVSNGQVTTVGGEPRTNFNMMLDFGYRYAGANSLSGTVGLDGAPENGVMGTGPSGVSPDEVPFGGETMSLHVWFDANSNGVMEAAELVFIGDTQTGTNGDYAFTGLPDSLGAGTNYYVVSMAAPFDHLRLTTSSTPGVAVTAITNYAGEVLSARQAVAVSPAVTNVDFAYVSPRAYDFGDLPESYSTTLGSNPDGPRHRVPAATNLFLGASVNTENNGQPSPTAALDAYDDGVAPLGYWRNASGGGSVRVQVGSGAGWLAGYIDFNGNGTFADTGEMVVTQAVSATGGNGSGLYTLAVNVPTGSIHAGTGTVLNARFRLFSAAPVFLELAYSGLAEDGEVEDYQWNLGALGDTVWVDADRNGVRDAGEAPLAGVRVFVDLNSNGVWSAEEPAAVTDTNGVYGIGGLSAGSYRVIAETSSLPVGLVAVYDADGGADSRAQVALAAGEANAGVDFGYDYPTPAVQLVKTAGGAADGAALSVTAGSNVVYRYHVVNAGDSFLVNLAVEDDILGAVGAVAGPLAPGASFDLYKTNLNVMAAVTNIGTVTATPAVADGTPIAALEDVTDSDDAVVLLALEIRGLVWMENGGVIDGVRSNDVVYPGIAITLLAGGTNGAWVAGATTDVNGAYAFTNVTTGVAYTVQFKVVKTNTLYKYFAVTSDFVVADGPDRVTVGNDALFVSLNSNDAFAVASIGPTQIVYGSIVYVDAGLGTNDPTHTLSTDIELRLYEAAGGTFVELCTRDEVAEGLPIILFVRYPDGTILEVGRVMSLGGSRRYLLPVNPALFARPGPFTLIVRDESGADHELRGITLDAFKARLTRMDKTGFTLTWASLPGHVYDIYQCDRMGGPWRKVAANIEADGTTCSALVPTAGASQAFFKIVMLEDGN